MALIVDADGKYLSGGSGSFGTGNTEVTVLVWTKSIDYTSTGVFASFGPSSGTADTFNVGRAPHWYLDGHIYPSNIDFRLNASQLLSQENTTWHCLAVTHKQGVSIVGYVDGSARYTDTTESAVAADYDSAMTNVMIGRGLDFGAVAWHTRARIAHVAMWNKQLTGSEIGELYNGGSGGAGKSPTAIQASNLKFYATLISDATVHTGGVSLSATGSPSYDSDNPSVDAAGGGAGPGEDDLGGSAMTGGAGTAAAAFSIGL